MLRGGGAVGSVSQEEEEKGKRHLLLTYLTYDTYII